MKGIALLLERRPSHRADSASANRMRLTALVEEHFELVWRLLRRWGLSETDADDAAQQVFMVAIRKIDRIVPGSEGTFLYGTALRVAANARRKANRVRAAREDPEPVLETESSPHRELELRRARALLDQILALMPDDLRRVLVLAEIERRSVPEIARLESIPTGTAASRLRRARARFRELLVEADDLNPFKGPADGT